ncbi:uncharacterized protein METZ01_LOCUS327357, partial [marine metagenome]
IRKFNRRTSIATCQVSVSVLNYEKGLSQLIPLFIDIESCTCIMWNALILKFSKSQRMKIAF